MLLNQQPEKIVTPDNKADAQRWCCSPKICHKNTF